MHIHIRYGIEKNQYVMVFDHNIITIEDVLKNTNRIRNSEMLLLDSDNKRVKCVEKGKSYKIVRIPWRHR